MLEVDGLSYQRIKQAIADGIMPTLKGMMDEEGYQLSRMEAGVPPTTPACQAGILQGNNTNIPAFCWLDKKTRRLLAGGGAAAEIEPILSDGNGLLRGGTSIGNMFSGDAARIALYLGNSERFAFRHTAQNERVWEALKLAVWNDRIKIKQVDKIAYSIKSTVPAAVTRIL